MREEVRWFSGKMEEKLRNNDNKGGWAESDMNYLASRLDEEFSELISAAIDGNNEDVISEAVDVANFAMMIADKARKEESDN